MKPHQQSLTDWAIRKGRGAIYADTGLGKTIMFLTWAENIVRHTNKPVLILTPLAVAWQTVKEGEKFGIKVVRSPDGKLPSDANIIVTNYDRLHLFSSDDFAGCACDESAVIRNFEGKRASEITEFMRRLPYRLLCTATAAPNDYDELGTSSEALGELGYQDMITKFFKVQTSKDHLGWARTSYRLKGHADHGFWRWVCSWARACRKPSDLGFDDTEYLLPPLVHQEHVVIAKTKRPGFLIDLPAVTLSEQREERRRTLRERCEKAAELIGTTEPGICWSDLNDEGDLLEKIIPGSVQVSGADTDEEQEEKLLAFISGQARVLVSKPRMTGIGLNLQHCSHQTFFPSHSFLDFYQAVRRCWRFGQKKTVTIDMIASEGELGVLENLQRKSDAADVLFDRLIQYMHDHLDIRRGTPFTDQASLPDWLEPIRAPFQEIAS